MFQRKSPLSTYSLNREFRFSSIWNCFIDLTGSNSLRWVSPADPIQLSTGFDYCQVNNLPPMQIPSPMKSPCYWIEHFFMKGNGKDPLSKRRTFMPYCAWCGSLSCRDTVHGRPRRCKAANSALHLHQNWLSGGWCVTWITMNYVSKVFISLDLLIPFVGICTKNRKWV